MARIVDHEGLRTVLGEGRVVAVVGASSDPAKAGHYVPAYLAAQGYEIWAVNPALAGTPMFGREAVGSLADIPVPIDIIEVFRRPDQLPGHLAEFIAAKPRWVWLQQGIRHEGVVAALGEAGIDVVESRCMLVDHRALGIGHAG